MLKKWGLLFATFYIWGITFLTERYIFVVEERVNHLGDYVVCKGIQWFALYFLLRFLYRAVISKEKEHNLENKILFYAIPYLLFLIVYYLMKTKLQYTGDEANIFNSALSYQDMSGWFNYQTGYFHIISIMTFPIYHAPIIAKFILQSLIVGYIVYRYRTYFSNKGYLFIYLLFMASKAMLGQAMNMSRTPIYGIFYGFFIAKLLFDFIEKRSIQNGTLAGICLVGALMTQWRNEGIGLLVFLPVLLILAYRIKEKKEVLKVILVTLVIQLCIFIPQSVDTYSADDSFVVTRMRPFYNYVLTNMLRNGLDREKFGEQLERIDRYVSIDAIDRINRDFGRNAYDDEYIFWLEDYKGIREEATTQDYVNFTEAVKEIIIKNPVLFAKSQIGAWNYTSTRYFPTSRSQISQWYRFFSFELYLPTIVMLGVFVGSFWKKQWFHFFLSCAILCQTAITIILMPAAIFNYFYVIYLGGYFYFFYVFISWIGQQRSKQKR